MPDYRLEAEILFAARAAVDMNRDRLCRGTTFAGTGPVCDKSLTPDPVKAERLRTQKYW